MSEHLVSDFMKAGCKTERDAAIAFQVYLELCEIKRYWDIEYYYSDELECLYITGKISKSSPPSFFVPVSASERISFQRMQGYLTLNKTVTLAMVESDSTCVYYQISDGISEPPEETPSVSREEKRLKLDNEVKKNRKFLMQCALYQIPFNLPQTTKNITSPLLCEKPDETTCSSEVE